MVDLPDEVKNMDTGTSPAPSKPEGEAPRHRDAGSTESRPGGRPAGDRPGGYGARPGGYGGRSGGYGGRSGGPGGRGGGPGGARRPYQRRRRRMFGGGKVCQCCVRKIKTIDYKDLEQLKFFVSNQGKILPRRMSGACSRHQRILSAAIKRARQIAMIPFKQ